MKKQLRERATRSIPSTTIAMMVVEELSLVAPHCPVLKKAAGAMRAKQWVLAFDLLSSLHPQSYDAEATFLVAQARAAISKVVFPGLDPTSAAISRWYQAEHRCKRTNQRLRAWRRRESGKLGSGKKLPYSLWIERARKFIRNVLSEEPPMGEIIGMGRFGPGATVGVGGDATHYLSKLQGKWDVTPTAAPYACRSLMRDPAAWEHLDLAQAGLICYDEVSFATQYQERVEYIHYDVTLLVPKNAKTHRFICKQPSLNALVQLGVGDWMSERLRAFGCDLRDQTRNQRLAAIGSKGGYNTWATLDMEMASDTISFETVKLLLPPEWFNMLNRIRTAQYKSLDEMGGQILTYEKFSAMGNGFTFPLETLIFMACCHAVNGASTDEFSVYGDDIILRQSDALACIELMSFLGFRTNNEKSFVFGLFKESCGSDYFDGCNVRPAYVKGEQVYPEHLIGLHNRIMRSQFLVLHRLAGRLRRLWYGYGYKHLPWTPIGGVSQNGFAHAIPFPDSYGPYFEPWDRKLFKQFVVTPVYDVEGSTLARGFLAVSAVLTGATEQEVDGKARLAFAFRRRVQRSLRNERPIGYEH